MAHLWRRYVPARLRTEALDLLHRTRWRRAPHRKVTKRFVKYHGLEVQRGPFSGMRFPPFAVGRGEMVVPQLLGSYEEELQAIFERLAGSSFTRIVDIGASDGYYAVGLALKWPQVPVIAYEVNPFPSRVCEAMAAVNGVRDRIDLRGECTVEVLRELDPGAYPFVLCDCEGAEAELMDPERVTWLRFSMLIVELHEFASPGVTELISARFAPTHEIEILESRRRYAADYAALAEVPGINYIDRELGISEFRPVRISWAVMNPR
jgi:hypothetical protein